VLEDDSRPVIASETKHSRRHFRQKSTPFTHVEAWFLGGFVALLLAMTVSSAVFNTLLDAPVSGAACCKTDFASAAVQQRSA
jgi:hypothetical protein